MSNKRETVITGIGVLSTYGLGKDIFWENLINGISGIKEITGIKTHPLLSKLGGQITDFKLEERSRMALRANNYCQYSFATAKMAIKDANIPIKGEETYKIGVLLGSNMGHPVIFQYADMGDLMKSQYIYPNIGTSLIAIENGIKGTIMSIAVGESSGASCVELGVNLIRSGKCSAVIVGGTDVLARMNLLYYGQLNEISPTEDDPYERCVPFDKKRNGLILAEGSAFVVLEEKEHAQKRGASIYCRIAGVGSSYSSRFSSMNGHSSIDSSMQKAIKDSSLSKSDIGLIYGSGNGGRRLDKAEMAGIEKVFGRTSNSPYLSSIKSIIGETQGAGGIFNLITSIFTFNTGKIVPIVGFEESEYNLNFVKTSVDSEEINSILCNSISYGGNSVSLIVSKE